MTIYFPHWWTRDDVLYWRLIRWPRRAVYRLMIGPVLGPEPIRCSLEVEP